MKHFAAGTLETLVLTVPDARSLLKPGKNKVQREVTGKNTLPVHADAGRTGP